MNTYQIKPESFDSLETVIDQLDRCTSAQVLIHIPPNQQFIQNKVDFLLLTRKARRLGKYLAFVTRDSLIIEYAAQSGVQVFSAAEDAAGRVFKWDRKFLLNPVSKKGKRKTANDLKTERMAYIARPLPAFVRILTFVISILAVIVLLGSFVPQAEVHLLAAPLVQDLQLTLQGGPDLEAPSITGNVVYHVQEIQLTQKQQAKTSGTKNSPDTPAVCELEVINKSNQVTFLPRGSVFRTNNQAMPGFQTEQDYTLPAAMKKPLLIPVKANQPGVIGNLGEGTITVVPWGLRNDIESINPQSCSGGTDVLISIVTKEDAEALREPLQQTILSEAQEELRKIYGDDLILPDNTLKALEVIEEMVQPEPGKPGDYVQVVQTARVTLSFFLKEDIKNTILLCMDAALNGQQEAIPNTLEYKMPEAPQLEGDQAIWTVEARRQYLSFAQEDGLQEYLKAKSIDEAMDIVTHLEGVDSASYIRMYPGWLKRMPLYPFRINVIKE